MSGGNVVQGEPLLAYCAAPLSLSLSLSGCGLFVVQRQAALLEVCVNQNCCCCCYANDCRCCRALLLVSLSSMSCAQSLVSLDSTSTAPLNRVVMASHRPSFSGLLSHVPESVRRDVEPPDFFAAFPQLVQPLTRVPLSVDDNDVPVANGLAPTSAESASATGERMLRCVCVSDTHNAHRRLVIPPADVLIHSGDFSDIGLPHDVNEFCDWLDSLTQVKHKVVVAGNHDLSLDRTSYPRNWKRFNHPKAYDSTALINRLKQSCIYLDHECVDIEGVRFFGSPYQPEFYDWAFNLGRENFECYDKWASIADVVRVHQANAGGEGRGSSGTASMVDVLITHGPPLGVLDLCEGNRRQGCLDLLDFTLAARPRLHVFGHIHEEFGLVQHQGTGTIYCNASMMDVRMRMLSPVDGGGRRVPIVVDVPIPAQHKRLRNCVSTAVPGSS